MLMKIERFGNHPTKTIKKKRALLLQRDAEQIEAN
jgi:hypothetical protein